MILFFLLSCSTVQRSNTPHGEQCIVHDHLYRCWNSHVPSDVPENPPLVIDMHYWTGDAEDQRQLSGFEALSDSEGFIVVWPYGLNLSWNSGPACCEPSSMDGTDDVGFIRELVAEIAQQYPIDLNRVYVTGLSNGCSMSQRLANEASDLVAAAACMAMNLVVPPAENYTPVSVMNLMGTADDLYSESEDGFPGSISNLNTWKMMNNCIVGNGET